MSKKSIYLLGILLTILIGMYFYWKVCCQCDQKKACCKTDVVESNAVNQKNGFSVSSDAGGGLNVSATDNYNFLSSGSVILEPISDQVTDGVGKIKAFLDANPNQQLSIVGLYKSSETNNTAYPDLGMARANAVKNHMVAQGISAKSLFTSSKLDDAFSVSNDTLFGPLSYNLAAAASEGTDWAALGAEIKANPLILYFDKAKSNVSLTEEQRATVAKIANYLDHAENASCIVVGHTDNDGSAATNQVLGLKRAEFAKQYLVTNGINASQIETASKGSAEPIADNTTDEGKAKNRRSVITIK